MARFLCGNRKSHGGREVVFVTLGVSRPPILGCHKKNSIYPPAPIPGDGKPRDPHFWDKADFACKCTRVILGTVHHGHPRLWPWRTSLMARFCACPGGVRAPHEVSASRRPLGNSLHCPPGHHTGEGVYWGCPCPAGRVREPRTLEQLFKLPTKTSYW